MFFEEVFKLINSKNGKVYDVNQLIKNHKEPIVWMNHMEEDLMKFWRTKAATEFQGGLFSTYRSNEGNKVSMANIPEEIKEAQKYEETKGLIDLDHNYVRAHSRQTFAYGIAYNMTGNEDYLSFCKKGAYALVNAVDVNRGMFTKQNIQTGEWGDPADQRVCQDLAYGITGLGMYYYLTHDEGILKTILDVKNYIFDQYLDQGKGIFTWLPKSTKGTKVEIVSQLDQIYGYMIWLTPALPEPHQARWKSDLKMIVDILLQRFYSQRYEFFWGVGSTPTAHHLEADHTDFGHSVKTMWLIHQVGILLENSHYVMFAREKIDEILEKAYISKTKSWGRRLLHDNSVDEQKEWWGLAELDQACAILAINDPTYLEYLNNTYDYWFEHMVDKTYGEIWHMVDKDGKPVSKYPKVHCWKTSLHSFEHCLFGYLTSSEIKKEEFKLYYAFESSNEPLEGRVHPYLFKGNIVNVETCLFDNESSKYNKVRVTFDGLR